MEEQSAAFGQKAICRVRYKKEVQRGILWIDEQQQEVF